MGYIIGPRVSGTLFAGGVISWLVIMPAIKFFGSLGGNVPLYPSTIPITQMTPDELWGSYIRPMGAGAVAASGLITLIKTLPTIYSALTRGVEGYSRETRAGWRRMKRTERDMSMRVVVIGSAVIVAMMWALLTFKPIPGAMTSGLADFLAAIFVVTFGFLFVTVASRISGLIGNSSNPISGMTIATLMATCAVFLVIHWTSTAHAGAGADDWRRGLHRVGDCGRDFAGSEDRISGGRDAVLAADGAGDRRDGVRPSRSAGR